MDVNFLRAACVNGGRSTSICSSNTGSMTAAVYGVSGSPLFAAPPRAISEKSFVFLLTALF